MPSTAYNEFYVDKGLAPFSDLLTVFGLAEVISAVLYDPTENRFDLRIVDDGMYYRLICSPTVDEAMLEQRIMPQRPIQTLKTKLPEGIAVYDYEAEKTVVSTYFAAKRQNTDAEPPRVYWDVLRAINPAALPGYNALMLDWDRVTGHPDVLRLLFDLFSQSPNDVEGTVEGWKQLDKTYGWGIDARSTAQQLYNPDSGKGQNRAKANGLSIGNIDSFWLVEWLKAVGFYQGALTRLVRGTKDRKTFVIAPRELTYQEHRVVMSNFVSTMQFAETSTRFDILAMLRYLTVLLNYLQEPDSPLANLLKRGRVNIKKRLVNGFYTAFYKDMGNAVATMNLAFMALPGWITVESREEVSQYHDLLQEFERFVRQFDETHSDAFTLLQDLRDFVSGDDIRAFFRFTNAFPAYLMGMRERNKPARQLTVDFIERLMMNSEKPLYPLLASSGFQNIAYAIRQSTVVAQYRKKQGDRKYDIRYGLGQELARKARYPHEFITGLSDFLHKYNAENAQVMETRQGPYRRSIQTSDIEELVRLIDEYGSEPVANLLIAYGYARTPRDPQDSNDVPPEDAIEETGE